MKCPYCNEEMHKGYINGDGRFGLCWLPEGEEITLHTKKGIRKHGGIVLSSVSIFSPVNLLAHVCKICHKVIIDYED